MHWLFRGFRLRQRGVIGLNARNAGAIMGHNPRGAFPLVDDKIIFAEMCQRVGIPIPPTRAIFANHGDLHYLTESLNAAPDGVIKPARGSGGRGIMVLVGHEGTLYRRAGGQLVSVEQIRQHISDGLSGLYSLGDQPDRMLLQHRVGLHPMFAELITVGTPDIRVIVFKDQPVLAMLRLPTLESAGRANLHQGGIGVGIDLASGTTTHAIWHHQAITHHPDTRAEIAGRTIPDWGSILTLARRAARVTGLGYLGIDIVLDPQHGALLLEANARPGLAIQLANRLGIKQAIQSATGSTFG